MDQQFADALELDGKDYLRAETGLRDGGASASADLRKHLGHPDAVARWMAQCLLEWTESKPPEYQEAIDYLEGLPRRFARTPVKTPPSTGVAAELEERYGNRVAGILALRLWKQADDWEDWQVGAVLFYLRDQGSPEITAALVRFAAETPNERYRRAAVEVLRDLNDPNLGSKLADERRRVELKGLDFPDALKELEATRPSP